MNKRNILNIFAFAMLIPIAWFLCWSCTNNGIALSRGTWWSPLLCGLSCIDILYCGILVPVTDEYYL